MKAIRIKNNTNGHPRYVVHFFELLTEAEIYSKPEVNNLINQSKHLDYLYSLALKRARIIGGRKFHNKQFGGGIAFVSYNLDNTLTRIDNLKGSL